VVAAILAAILDFNIKEGFGDLGKHKTEIFGPSNLVIYTKITVLAALGA
jgi:hypothetical protein